MATAKSGFSLKPESMRYRPPLLSDGGLARQIYGGQALRKLA